MAATEDKLSQLHDLLADAMQKKLDGGDATASDLNVIRQFLKDNGIECDGRKSDKMQGLAHTLPDLDSEDEDRPFH